MAEKVEQAKYESRFIVGRKAILEARLDMNTHPLSNKKSLESESIGKKIIPADKAGHVQTDMPLLHAYELMTKQQMQTLPVTENGRLRGVITLETVAQYVPQPNQAMLQTTLNDVMETNPITLSPETTVHKAAKVMLAEEIDMIPVVDKEDRWLGIIRLEDILQIMMRS
jgi:predicted transcriptional regulator